jgi:ABC-type multidrug transport system fused ATPase/permease subunit
LFAAAAIYTYCSAETLENTADFVFLVTGVILLMRFFPVTGQVLTMGLKVVADARAGRDVTGLVSQYRPPGETNRSVSDGAPSQIEIVEVKSLDFSYVHGKQVLRDVDIRFVRGHSYALIGRSGSGKSTFMDLMLRFYAPDSGEICLDGVNIQTIDEKSIRQRILLVTQEVSIFNDTIGNNIRFGLIANDDEVMRACHIACIDDLISDLPQGLNTQLAYRGTNLSGGQRQRIGLARALLRRPAMLLLDESTSALDAVTRARVVENLLAEYKDKILVFVTHDAYVIEAADVILDMAQINRVVA